MRVTDDCVIAYFDGIHARRGEAVRPELVSLTFSDGSSPRQSCCHENVERYVRENPESAAVRGWTIIGEIAGHLHMGAHSVVDAHGSLIDITPLPHEPIGFISHLGTDEEFRAAREGRAAITWPPLPAISVDPPEPVRTRTPLIR
jgi:hypothetical protein